jgi:hypothetical protein
MSIQTNFRASDMLGVSKPAAAKPAAKVVPKTVAAPKPVVEEAAPVAVEMPVEVAPVVEDTIAEAAPVVAEVTPEAKKINKPVKG